MAADLAVADNSGVTTDGEIIVCTLQNLQFPQTIEEDSWEETFKSRITSIVSHGCCQNNFYARQLCW